MMAPLLALAALLAALAVDPAQPSGPASAAPQEPGAAAAEIKALRTIVERQRQDIARLERQVAELQRQVRSTPTAAPDAPASPAPATPAPASAPAVDPRDRAARVVFLLDASGSMINVLAPAAEEIAARIDALEPGQSFEILWARDESAGQAFGRLVPATERNRAVAQAALARVSATGTTNLLAGLEAAFRLQPDAVWMVSDGDVPDNNRLLAATRRLNRGRRVRLNTIVVVPDGAGPTDEMLDFMKRLARDNGGVALKLAAADTPTPTDPRLAPAPTANTTRRGGGPRLFEEYPGGPPLAESPPRQGGR